MLSIAFHPSYELNVPATHRFPMEKYPLIAEQLLYEGICTNNNFFIPEIASLDLLTLTHNPSYIHQVINHQLDDKQMLRIGFSKSDALIERELRIMQGTVSCAINALDHKISFNIAGGTHHAFSNKGEGFCIFNDNAIAAHYLLDNKLASRILIIDLDVHQGNGTAEIFKDEPNVFTFSIHGKNNFPFEKEVSDCDVPLLDGTDDKTYLYLLKYHLNNILNVFQPDFIFYQSGVDILYSDKMGKLNCTIEGCRTRDEIVFNLAKQLGVPIVCNMGGGYSNPLKNIINAHINTFKTGINIIL